MRIGIVLLMGSLTAPLWFAETAAAQPVTGMYIGGSVGENFLANQRAKNLSLGGVGRPGAAHALFHNGYTGQGSIGYGFSNGFRVELEGDYISNQISKVSYANNQYLASGQEQKWGAFVNGYYDFNVGIPYLYPYLGVGVGWQDENINNFASHGFTASQTKGTFAYQGIAGAAFPIPGNPNLSATLEYRFTALTSAGRVNGSVGGVPGRASVEGEYNNSFQVGLRYAFGVTPPPAPAPAPAPAPVAAPAPAPAKTYLVFFDWDKYNLTPRAVDIISQAASDSKTQQTTQIICNGYTDTSGTFQYNMGLGERRAQAVAAQLVTDGVPQSEIEVHSYGETHLLVPTGPGVREPQNRRVEIILQ